MMLRNAEQIEAQSSDPVLITLNEGSILALSRVLLLKIAVFASLFTTTCSAQQAQPAPPQGGGMSGIASGVISAPVYDEQKRPITAGGFVDKGPVVFENITKQAGLSGWIHKMGVPEKKFIVEANGSGVCLIDFDNDGWLDIYLVNGSTFDALDGKEPPPQAALFRNNHDGTFTDVSAHAGVTNERWGYGCSVADYDNDGWPDLFVGNYGKNRLYHNNHDRTFTDVAEKAGVTLGNWSTGSAWGDYDGDGRLDLYVAGYVHYDRVQAEALARDSSSAACLYRGFPVNCGPRGLPGEPDHLFHNNGDGTFTDVTQKAGVEDKNQYYGFTPIFISLKGDGRPDLLVGNDSEPNFFYHNNGNGTFEDQGYISGLAFNKDGREIASMGIAAGDYDNNGLVDFFITDFSDDYKVLFHNDGDAGFTDVSYDAGLAQTTIPFVGWGDGFIDYDNDGWPDLFMANGHVYPQVDEHDWGTTFAERPLLFHNVLGRGGKGRRFDYIPPVTGTGLATVVPARGAAFGDLFNDGKIDVIINPIDGPPVLLRNVNPDNHHWVEVRLIGGMKGPRDATCATAYLTANGMRQRRDVLSSGSYISADDRRMHFGLGDSTDPGNIEIHWPSGGKETVKLSAVDRIYTITEGKGITDQQCGTKPCADTQESQKTSIEAQH